MFGWVWEGVRQSRVTDLSQLYWHKPLLKLYVHIPTRNGYSFPMLINDKSNFSDDHQTTEMLSFPFKNRLSTQHYIIFQNHQSYNTTITIFKYIGHLQ